MRYLLPIAIILGMSGCDKIDAPVPPAAATPGESPTRSTTWKLQDCALVSYVYNTGTDEVLQVSEKKILGAQNGNGSSGTMRRVLLEDFTGHRCNNCPAAASTAQQLQQQYPDQLVVVGIHVTQEFAAPQQNGPNGSYSTDFRTEAGNAYEQAFNIGWLPAGMVNRKVFNSTQLLSYSSWPSHVGEMIGLTAAFDVFYERIEVDTLTNLLTAEVKVAVLQNVQGSYNLTVYLTEDHVIDWQYDAGSVPPDVPDYEHRHVLRANLNGPWGTAVINGSASAGDTLTIALPPLAI